MKLVSSLIGGIGLAVVASMIGLGACGGDKSAVGGTGGTTAATGGDSNAGGNTSSDTAAAGGSNNAGGTTSAGTTNPYVWGFYQDKEGWDTGIYPSGNQTGVVSNVQNQTFCDGGCADVLVTFNGDTDQAVNFMKYWDTNLDFTGKKLTAKIKVVDDSGVISAIDLHAENDSTNHYKWSQKGSVNSSSTPSLASVISSTTAVTISVPIAPDSGDSGTIFDPSAVHGIGLNIAGVSGVTGAAHVYIDSIEVTD